MTTYFEVLVMKELIESLRRDVLAATQRAQLAEKKVHDYEKIHEQAVSNEQLTEIYNRANGFEKLEYNPIESDNIFAAMRGMLLLYPLTEGE
jgi:hypothetical protein